MRTLVLACMAATAVVISGCASSPPPSGERAERGTPARDAGGRQARGAMPADPKEAQAVRAKAASQEALRAAYRKGARDVLEDFRGRMRAQEGFTYQPPMIDYVEMPARVVNGAMYPAHERPVIYRPGRWVERNGARYPVRANAPSREGRASGAAGAGGEPYPSEAREADKAKKGRVEGDR